jgi:hypothetical protein
MFAETVLEKNTDVLERFSSERVVAMHCIIA